MHPSGADLEHLASLVDAGELKPVIDRVFPFRADRRCLRLSGAGARQGKGRRRNVSPRRSDVTGFAGHSLGSPAPRPRGPPKKPGAGRIPSTVPERTRP
ncbi:zinc-binding dehydrogenase [Streptomyces niphimycinicus]|nr:zinc-binding dehydrogenase [Streptomyces niphimycinicus]